MQFEFSKGQTIPLYEWVSLFFGFWCYWMGESELRIENRGISNQNIGSIILFFFFCSFHYFCCCNFCSCNQLICLICFVFILTDDQQVPAAYNFSINWNRVAAKITSNACTLNQNNTHTHTLQKHQQRTIVCNCWMQFFAFVARVFLQFFVSPFGFSRFWFVHLFVFIKRWSLYDSSACISLYEMWRTTRNNKTRQR